MVWWCLRAPYSKMPLLLSSNIIKWTVETGALQLFIKASQNFREIHYHFSVPASRQLIQASRGAYTTLNNLCYCGPLLQDYGPGRAEVGCGPGRAVPQNGLEIAGRAENFRPMHISSPDSLTRRGTFDEGWCQDFSTCCQALFPVVLMLGFSCMLSTGCRSSGVSY